MKVSFLKKKKPASLVCDAFSQTVLHLLFVSFWSFFAIAHDGKRMVYWKWNVFDSLLFCLCCIGVCTARPFLFIFWRDRFWNSKFPFNFYVQSTWTLVLIRGFLRIRRQWVVDFKLTKMEKRKRRQWNIIVEFTINQSFTVSVFNSWQGEAGYRLKEPVNQLLQLFFEQKNLQENKKS